MTSETNSMKRTEKEDQETEKKSSKNRAVQQFLQKIYQKDGLTQKVNIQHMSKKKSAVSLTDNNVMTEKTAKIKKNKKKKKKGGQICAELKKEKIIHHEICQCCLRKRLQENSRSSNEYQSDQDALDEEQQNYMAGFIQSLVQDNLQKYYDEIDRGLKLWLKEMEKDSHGTFINLMAKLGEVFQCFQGDLYEEMHEESEDTHLLESYEEDIAEEFKTYIITRFPLLKDFIDNFPLSDLEWDHSQILRDLTANNSLINLIFTHILEIQNKRTKKKNKRKNKKEKKVPKKQDKTSVQHEVGSSDPQTVIQRLNNLKFDQTDRQSCFYNEQWLQRLIGKRDTQKQNINTSKHKQKEQQKWCKLHQEKKKQLIFDT